MPFPLFASCLNHPLPTSILAFGITGEAIFLRLRVQERRKTVIGEKQAKLWLGEVSKKISCGIFFSFRDRTGPFFFFSKNTNAVAVLFSITSRT